MFVPLNWLPSLIVTMTSSKFSRAHLYSGVFFGLFSNYAYSFRLLLYSLGRWIPRWLASQWTASSLTWPGSTHRAIRAALAGWTFLWYSQCVCVLRYSAHLTAAMHFANVLSWYLRFKICTHSRLVLANYAHNVGICDWLCNFPVRHMLICAYLCLSYLTSREEIYFGIFRFCFALFSHIVLFFLLFLLWKVSDITKRISRDYRVLLEEGNDAGVALRYVSLKAGGKKESL